MSDITENIQTLIRIGLSPDEAISFVAEVFNLGVAASAYRDDVSRAKRQTTIGTGLRIVAQDEGGHTGD